MIKQGDGGRIINIASVYEDWPMPGNTAYCLSKDARRSGDSHQSFDHERPCADEEAQFRDTAGHMAQPEEIGSVVAFLAGPGASYVTATTIFADGSIVQSSPSL